MNQPDQSEHDSLLCARCGVELKPGKGNFYVLRIEALADPKPPDFSDEDLQRDPRAEIARLIAQMRDCSEQELLDQVYRRLVLYLCGPCYRQWIEDPTRCACRSSGKAEAQSAFSSALSAWMVGFRSCLIVRAASR